MVKALTDSSTKCFHSCHAYWPVPFYTTYSDLTLGKGHRAIIKQMGHLLAGSPIGMIKCDIMLKQFSLKNLILFLFQHLYKCVFKGNKVAALIKSQNVNVGKRSDISEPTTSFKLGTVFRPAKLNALRIIYCAKLV